MTDTLISPIPELAPPREAPPAVTDLVENIERSWQYAAPYRDQVEQEFYRLLFHLSPSARDFFPVSMQAENGRVVRALLRVLRLVHRPDDLVPVLRQLGRDHRKFGLRPDHYEAVGTALLGALKHSLGPVWTPEVERAWAEAYTLVARAMQEAAEEADADGVEPPFWLGTVAEHHRLSWDLALVRVEFEQPVPYRAGQYLSVEVPQRPRLWRCLSPANAPRADGSLEFHVRAVDGGWVSRAIVGHTRIGDVWKFGAPMGRLHVDRESARPVLLIAGGTGVAPLQANLDDLGRWVDNPEVTLFYGARHWDDLYALDQLYSFSATNPWLTVWPVVEDPASAPQIEHGTLAEAVTRWGPWTEHDILVSGPPGMIESTVVALLRTGVHPSQIVYDPFLTV
ncbi:FAD-binding oxidoreductase [Saccharomonospora azurea]|uniref:FAD-binding oxidoreductase n=1 Tax=Saccharomonospora azurea TaxID=40988 RepID=UPI000240080F|nr:FAD-binding oxidoreductase [Saccharomonospora azurea]EHK86949.1 2-polyprenylphenol hydroxylase-like oxidoreductase [Saccharomonospora azurea SZMC 14600]